MYFTSAFAVKMYYRPRPPHWVKIKNPNAPAVKREAEEDQSGGSYRSVVSRTRFSFGFFQFPVVAHASKN